MTTAELQLFGVPRLTCDARPVEFGRRKSLALVAYLAVSGQTHSRDSLATLLWPNNDATHARAALRRVLATINETPFGGWLVADRETMTLRADAALAVDVVTFDRLMSEPPTPDTLTQAIALYTGSFMEGFTLRDSAAFDDWQAAQTQRLLQQLVLAFDRLSLHYLETRQLDRAAETLRHWTGLDPLHESAQYRLIEVYGLLGRRSTALAQYDAYAALLETELGLTPAAETRQLVDALRNDSPPEAARSPQVRGTLPFTPSVVIGREATLTELKTRLMPENSPGERRQVVLQGWPGIGKSTLSAVLAHDTGIQRRYPDGILWTSLGQAPNPLAVLAHWAQSLGIHELDAVQNVEEASARLTALVKDHRLMLIVDDAWAVEHAVPLLVGGPNSGLLVTTRLNDVAYALAAQPQDVFKVPILSSQASLRLLETLAPGIVADYPDEAAALVGDLEGLPLAIQVAGRLLQAEIALGWGIHDLLVDLAHGTRLLNARAPADRTELVNETTPSVAVLLQRSVERLAPAAQEQFALLGVFAPKPASFTLDAIAAVWDVDNPRAGVRLLVDRGLLEPAGDGRFQMHALLVVLARSMFTAAS